MVDIVFLVGNCGPAGCRAAGVVATEDGLDGIFFTGCPVDNLRSYGLPNTIYYESASGHDGDVFRHDVINDSFDIREIYSSGIWNFLECHK